MPLHLLADIGGTHCRFTWRCDDAAPPPSWQCATGAYPSFENALSHVLTMAGRAPAALAIAAAGPVTADICHLTNASWTINRANIAAHFRIPRVALVNDLAAVAHSLPHLPASAFRHLGGPERAAIAPPALVLGIGTGLGSAILAPGDNVIACEGGQANWASSDPAEAAVLQKLKPGGQHLPAESALAASALGRLYAALAPTAASSPPIAAPDIPGRVASDPVAAETMQLYAQMLGRYAGNAVLMTGARGGLYIAGDALNAWGTAFNACLFYRSFLAKGRFSAYLGAIPVKLITAPDPAFAGLNALLAPADGEAAAEGRLA